jgi:hypothetical protein
MSATFIATAVLAVVLLINWRLVLLLLAACLVAMILMGLGVVDGEASAERGAPATTTAPVESAQGAAPETVPETR